MNIVNTEDMRVLEINSRALGVPTLLLMENAGASIARVIELELGSLENKDITIVAGKGGKAGDSFVAARHLSRLGAKVKIYMLYHPSEIVHDDAKFNYRIISKMKSIAIQRFSRDIDLSSNVIIDGLLGTGIKGRVREPAASAIELMNRAKGIKIAIDVPSGIDPDTGEVLGIAFKADITVTMHAIKPGLIRAKEYVGKVVVANIGIPSEAWTYLGPGDIIARIRRKPRTAKKGDGGRILVIAGSSRYIGAPWLTALAAWAAGADIVTLAAPTPVLASRFSPEIIGYELSGEKLCSDHIDKLISLAGKHDVVAMGPGLGLDRETMETANRLIETLINKNKPLVIDADALKALALIKNIDLRMHTVVTPHLGEASLMLGKSISNDPSSRILAAIEISKKFNTITVLKGYVDIVTDGEMYRIREGISPPDMSRGGTGDVLTGLIAGLIPRTSSILSAAYAGVMINAIAGGLAYKYRGASYPLYLIDFIPQVIKDPEKSLKSLMEGEQ